MKRTIALAALLFALLQLGAAALLYEGFDDTIFPPPNWKVYNADGGVNMWERLANHQRTGAACAACFDETDRDNNDWLITPSLIPMGADTLLDWWYRGQSIGHIESIEIWISHTTQDLDSFDHFVAGRSINSNAYLPETVSVAAWLGQRIYLGIRYCPTPSQLNMYLDDIWAPVRLLDDVGVAEVTVPADTEYAGTTLYPNVGVHNWGDSAHTAIPVYLVIRDSATGAPVFTDNTLSGSVPPESTVAVSFTGGWLAAPGTYWVESWTMLPSDLRPNNDSIRTRTLVVVAAPAVTVTSPNGGELWQVGSSHLITWTPGAGPAAGDSIWYRTSDAGPWIFIAAVGPDITSCTWNPVPNTPSESCMVRVKAFNGTGTAEDESDDHFTIAYQDVGAVAIVAPVGTLDSGSVITPRAAVTNFGSRTETFPVTFRIGSVYDQTVGSVTLGAGQTDTVDFPNWVAQPLGRHQVCSFTDLAVDQDRSNDTVFGADSITVILPPRHDVGATMILAPVGTLDSGWVRTPRAVVYNFGTRTETFPVTFQVGSGYDQTVSGVTLTPGQTDTIDFPNWVVQPVGVLQTRAFTLLSGDIHPENDTVTGDVTVLYPERHDVGATAILEPVGTIDSGTVVTPRAVVYNFQTRTETFPVTLRIGSVYDQTVSGITLTPGQTDTVSFPNWVAQPLGNHNVLAFTNLLGDENRANDTARTSITIQLPPRHDVGATAILAPLGTLDSGTVVTPRAVVRNFQTRTETFPATLTIGSVYNQTVSGITLVPGQIDTVDFPNWTAQPLGNHNVIAFTNLVGDQNRSNDTTRTLVTIQLPPRHDVGATAILAPTGTIDSGTVVTPRAVVYNFQTRTETFPVTFRIGSVYDQTVSGVTLVPGQTDTVDFPNWVAQPLGNHNVVAFTNLVGDQNRANDTTRTLVTIQYPPRFDVGTTAILAPVGTIDSGTVVTPRTVVYNFGTRNATFPATLTIGSVYNQTVSGITLVPGQTDTIDFPNWVAQPLGNHNVVAFTSLANDIRRSNDTARTTITIQLPPRFDVGTTAILAPVGTIDSGTVVTPRTVVYNFGTRNATFPASLTIGSVYNQTVSGITLTPGQSDTIDFPNWVAQPLGNHDVVAFTSLANDIRRGNDTARTQITIQLPPRHDVGATAILAPVGTLDSGQTVTPRAVVYNFQTRNETFPVSFRIGSVYDQTVSGVTLNPGQTDTVDFPDWVVQPVGLHATLAYTGLAGDENRSNDTVYGQVEVLYPERHDVGAVQIISPIGMVDSGTVVTPVAVIRNFGTRDEEFPVRFWISSVYSREVSAALAPGQVDTVAFPDWVAQPIGTHSVLAFTSLDDDRDRTNDTAFNQVDVQYPERHDVGATAILAPLGTLDSGTVVTPRAVVYNFQTRTETFPVTFRIGSAYDQTLGDITLAPGQTDTLDFPDWVVQPLGRHLCMAFTYLDRDENRSNDTVWATDSITVIRPPRHDVGALTILAPVGMYDSGTVVTPRATIENFGTRSETFPVTFAIGSVYYETVQRSLDPGETEEVAFPDWVAQPIGRYGTMCFTGLDTDRDRSNDTAYCSTGDSVIVLLPERHDVAVLSLLAPAGRHDSGAVVTPQAVVANVGTRDEEFPITFRIGSGYSQTVQRALSPGEQDTVSFADWTASPPGQLVTTCFTGLANDRNRANDTVSGEVTVDRVDDVGAQLVLAPSGETKLPEGILATTVTPKARITNYGPRPEANFEVLFRIDSLGRDSTVIGVAYERRDTVTQVIEPGASIEVEFPEAQLGLGEYAVACSTMLGTDRRPENDKASGYCRIAARVSGTTDGELEAVIYTRAGERVRGIKRSIQNGDPMLVQWDGMNDKGHACAPGIYICRLQFAPLQGTTEHQFFKLLVTTDFAGMVLTWRWQ